MGREAQVMVDLKKTDADAKAQLFDQLGDLHAGMLGVDGSGQHMQPMTPYFDRIEGKIWFITSRDTDLVSAVGQGGSAMFTFVGKKNDYYACMRGDITVRHDEAKLDEIWSVVAAAFFDDGRRDPEVTLLCLDLRDAAIWATDGNPFHFGLEIAKANMDRDRKPDLGKHVKVRF